MKKSDALKKLEKFCEDIEKDNAKNLAKWILEFVEQDLGMLPGTYQSTRYPEYGIEDTKGLMFSFDIEPKWEPENGEET